MTRLLVIAGCIVLALSCIAEPALACMCGEPPPPCAAFQATPVVFAGLVLSIEEQKVDVVRFGRKENIRTGLVAHFAVEEAFKGVHAATLDVGTDGGHGDCGYDFRVGERYLVYAFPTEGESRGSTVSRTVMGGPRAHTRKGTVRTSICSRTRHLSQAQNDLELIRALIAGKPQTRIFGSVVECIRRPGTYELDIDYVGPMIGSTILVESDRGMFETKTDDKGQFRIIDPPPGKYTVRVVYPKHYGPLYDLRKHGVEIELTSAGCSAEAHFSAEIDGRISGRVFEGDSTPVGKQVKVSIASIDTADKAIPLVESRSAYSDEQGRYEFEGVPPGRYLLGISIADVPYKHTPYSRTYYPHGRDRSGAMTIQLEKGQKLTDMDFHLSPRLIEQSLTGVVVLENGRPASGATVHLYDSEDPETEVFGFGAKTDAQGRFTIECLADRHYQLHAFLSENYLVGTGVQSPLLGVDAGDAGRSLTLILSKPGVFLRQLKLDFKK